MANTNNENPLTLEQMINDFSSGTEEKSKKTRLERKYDKYSKKFKEKFGRSPYIAEPSGTMESAIKAIKICLKEKKDILDNLYYNDKSNIY